jgi:hypothetical protein
MLCTVVSQETATRFTLKTTAHVALEVCVKDKIIDEVHSLNF